MNKRDELKAIDEEIKNMDRRILNLYKKRKMILNDEIKHTEVNTKKTNRFGNDKVGKYATPKNMHYRRIKNFDKDKPYFIHIPKTAGSELARKLKDKKGEKINRTLHTPARFLKEYVKDFVDNFSFCFIRNPYERFLSACRYNKVHDSEIEKLSDYLLRDKINWASDFSVSHYEHFFTQKHFVTDFDNETCIIKYIARYENIESEIKELEKNGIDIKDFVYKEPKSINWESDLTETTKENVRKIYSEDFLYFDYEI